MSANRERLRDFAVTLPSFDTPGGLDFFRKLDERGLAERILPPRPDERQERTAYRHWTEMLDKIERVEGASIVGDLDAASVAPLASVETSKNWSGAWIVPKGRRFHRVIAKWQVPRVRSAQSQLPRPPKCSIWVGFGGHRRWSKAMPQLGTEHRAASHDGAVCERHVAWVQWWVRGSRRPAFQPQELANPRLAPGDTVLCWVELLTSRLVHFFIRKRGDVVLYRVAFDMTKAVTRGLDAFGSSAEWIVERPQDFTTKPSTPFPLAAFSTVRFQRCAASRGYRQSRLRLIRMVQEHGLRSTLVSIPRRRGEPNGVLVVQRTGPIP